MAVGFTGTDVVVPDQQFPFHKGGILASTKKESPKPLWDVTFICHNEDSPIVRMAKHVFSEAGHHVHLLPFDSHEKHKGGIICLIEAEEAFFSAMTEAKWRTFQKCLRDIDQSSILWVTKETQVQCKNPNYALALGMARTIRSELAVEMATFEAQSFGDGFADALLMAYNGFRGKHGEANDREYEYLYRDGKLHVPRIHTALAENALSTKKLQSLDARMLSIAVPGSLGTMFWKPIACGPPQDDQIIVDIQYVGLNFRVRQMVLNL